MEHYCKTLKNIPINMENNWNIDRKWVNNFLNRKHIQKKERKKEDNRGI